MTLALAPAGTTKVSGATRVTRHAWCNRSTCASVVCQLIDACILGSVAFAVDGIAARVYCMVAFVALALAGRPGGLAVKLSRDLGALLRAMAIPLIILAPWLARPDAWPFLARFPVVAALVLTGRTVSYRLLRLARSDGLVAEPVVVVGAGNVGVRVMQALIEHPEYGLDPVGFVDSVDQTGFPHPILGDITDLERVLRDERARRVIVAYGRTREPDLVPVLRACHKARADVYIVPRFFELGTNYSDPCVEDLWGVPLVRLHRPASWGGAIRSKRRFDAVTSALLLVLAAPVLGAIAAAALLSSGRPVLFHQQRVGRDGKTFDLLKFRTLEVNDDSAGCWSVAGDARVTALGRILRASSLDELPQLWNVLLGHMSLVGPRPERPHFVDKFGSSIPGYLARHRVPGGITGWAQVHGLKGDTSIDERARFDNRYIEEWSPWLDLTILFRTALAVVRYRERGSPAPAVSAKLPSLVAPDPPVQHVSPAGIPGVEFG